MAAEKPKFDELMKYHTALKHIDMIKSKSGVLYEDGSTQLDDVMHAIADIPFNKFDDETTTTIINAIRSGVERMYLSQLNDINYDINLDLTGNTIRKAKE